MSLDGEHRARPDRLRLSSVLPAVAHIASGLLHSRILLVYVIFGVLSGIFMGPFGLVKAAINYLLLAVYVLVIYLWTRERPTVASVRRSELEATEGTGNRWRDLGLVVLLFAANMAYTIGLFGTGVIFGWFRGLRDSLLAGGWDPQLAGAIVNALANTSGVLIPALLLIFIFGLKPRSVGLVPSHIGLGLFLILIGITIGGVVKLTGGESAQVWQGLDRVPLALAIFAVMVFINGLPEELIYRGAIISRLLPWLRNPHNALVVSSVLFVLSHVPSFIARATGLPWWTLIIGSVLTPSPQPTGLAWGYLYYRTGSIWPGVLWHTSFVTLGIIFL